MTPKPGMKIGDYEVLDQLGAGGMGRVYKVKNELSDRVEAMKILLPDLEGQADLANRFLREIKVQAGMDHPHIAKLYTALRIENQLLMFMEFVEGITLDQRLRQGPIPMPDALDYAVQVLDALDYAHERGVVHRDIKPANMMLMPDGRIKLLDFGIAKAAMDSRLTMTGTTLGSLYYMAPEQIQGAQVDARSDLYSVGVSLYELVTGKKPFDGESQFAIMSAHLARPPVSPAQLKSDVPPALSELILLSLNKDPAARFQSAAAFLNALQTVQPEMGAPTMPPKPAPRSMAPRPATRPTMIPAQTLPVTDATPFDSLPSITAPGGAVQPPRPLTMQTPAPPPPVPQQEPFRLIEPSEPQPAKTGPNRLIWAAVGSLCAVGAIIAFIQFGPRGKTSAKETPAPPISTSTTQPPAERPARNTPVEPPPPSAPTAPAADANPGRPAPSSQSPVRRAQNQPKPAAPQTTSQAAQQPPAQPAPAQSTATQPQPAQTPPAQPQSADPRPGGTSLPSAVNKNRMDVNQLSEELDMMVVRANGIRVSLNDLQRAQNAQGLNLRADWVEAFNSMNTFLRKANQAVNDGNAADAKTFMGKAAVQIDLLEKGLGHR